MKIDFRPPEGEYLYNCVSKGGTRREVGGWQPRRKEGKIGLKTMKFVKFMKFMKLVKFMKLMKLIR